MKQPSVLIVAENASLRFGGEATKPFLLFRFFRRHGIDARLLVHDRCRGELDAAFPQDARRIHYVRDTAAHQALSRAGRPLPAKVNSLTLRSITYHLTQAEQQTRARALVRQYAIDVVHQPTPISPKQVCGLSDVGAPVVLGPMCGGMDYPPAFRHLDGALTRGLEWAARSAAQVLNRAFPGKLRAHALIVANERTRDALPRGTRGRVYVMPESGVELSAYPPIDYDARPADPTVRFVFLGRLVDWKVVNLLVEAFAGVARRSPHARLQILGDGPMAEPLRRQRDRLGLGECVEMPGWVSKSEGMERLRAADVFVLPSLRECGGNALLEAMAVGLPCVAANWGGPGAYLDDSCGIRVDPVSHADYVAGLTEGMLALAASPDLRRQMGAAARRRLSSACFTWEAKIQRMLEIYRDAVPTVRPA